MLSLKAMTYVILGAAGVYMVLFASFESRFMDPRRTLSSNSASLRTLINYNPAGPTRPLRTERIVIGEPMDTADFSSKISPAVSDAAAGKQDDEESDDADVKEEDKHKEMDEAAHSAYLEPLSPDLSLSLDDLPLPLKVMEQYKMIHSVESLKKNPENRKFSLGFYACPASAGNRIHEFANGQSHCITLLIFH